MTDPVISLVPACVLGFLLYVFHFIFIFWLKWRCVRNFRRVEKLQQFVHVLVNTVVVVPFSTWDVDMPADCDEDPDCSIGDANNRRSMSWSVGIDLIGREGNVYTQQQTNYGRTRGHARTGSHPEFVNGQARITTAVAPNRGAISALRSAALRPGSPTPLGAGVADVRRRITALWWRNPGRNLTLHEVRLREPETLGLQDPETLGQIFDGLVLDGLINKKLYPPQKTKREYFWLLAAHLAFNLMTLAVEVINGGGYTTAGRYYSWDIRFSAFFIGCVALVSYYRYCHVSSDLLRTEEKCCDLRSFFGVVFGCRKQENLSASPIEEDLLKYFGPPSLDDELDSYGLEGSSRKKSAGVTTATQTSVQTQTSVRIESDSHKNNNSKK